MVKNSSGSALWAAFYRLLWFFAPPFIRRYLKKRAEKSPAYLEHWDERFGKPFPGARRGAVWLHAVSVGETRAALPIVREILLRQPDTELLITQMTPTGRATAQQLFPQAQCRYLPYDKPAYVQQFLRGHRPKIGIFMETEIWPHLLRECAAERVPVMLANARLSEKSLKGYLKAAGLFRPAFASFAAVLAQTPEDAQRLEKAGAHHAAVYGNSKYDIAPDDAMRRLAEDFRQKTGGRAVVVCASTRAHRGTDEAELLLAAWRRQPADALLIIIPRHPERFQAAFDLAQQYGFRVQKRSDNRPVAPQTQVWIGDSMGEMYAYYLMADVVFVGGSLVDTGCQNIIEPIACGVPTLFGFSTFNFQAACADAQAAGAAAQIHSADEWARTCTRWLKDDALREHFRRNAAAFIRRHQGASARIAAVAAELCLRSRR